MTCLGASRECSRGVGHDPSCRGCIGDLVGVCMAGSGRHKGRVVLSRARRMSEALVVSLGSLGRRGRGVIHRDPPRDTGQGPCVRRSLHEES